MHDDTTSLNNETATGMSPPTDTPINQHMNTFVGKLGMAPQMLVAMKRTVERRMEYRRPTRSAMNPHKMDPTVRRYHDMEEE